MRRYAGGDADNVRWEGFEFRDGDILISAPSKCGTTWTQMLCALLVFDGPDLPAPLPELSVWVDMKTRRIEDVRRLYAGQDHRRLIKTHTPLDGLPLDGRVTYLCVGRDPRDAVISMAHHRANMDRRRVAELLDAAGEAAEAWPAASTAQLDDPAEQLQRWIDEPAPLGGTGEPLAAILHHFETFWERRQEPNVALFHFSDYVADLPGELARLAQVLGYQRSPGDLAALAGEASLERMRDRAGVLAPSADQGLWKDNTRFFRGGRVGDWRTEFTAEGQQHYDERVAEPVQPDLAQWVHHGRRARRGPPEQAD